MPHVPVLARARTLVAGLTLSGLCLLVAAPALAATVPELESCFLERINSARTAESIAPLSLSGDLTQYGRDHSLEMAESETLYHSDQDDLEGQLPEGSVAWGENVGYATGSDDCGWLFEGFWESQAHRDNLMNPIFDSVGIGVFVDQTDTMWTTHVFVQNGSSPPPSTTTTTSTTTTVAPAPTSTTTTTTTTTSIAPTTTSSVATTTSSTTASQPTGPTPPSRAPEAPVSDDAAAPPQEIETATADGSTTAGPLPGEADVAVRTGDGGCGQDCSTTRQFMVYLTVVGLGGLAISWWAFKA